MIETRYVKQAHDLRNEFKYCPECGLDIYWIRPNYGESVCRWSVEEVVVKNIEKEVSIKNYDSYDEMKAHPEYREQWEEEDKKNGTDVEMRKINILLEAEEKNTVKVETELSKNEIKEEHTNFDF